MGGGCHSCRPSLALASPAVARAAAAHDVSSDVSNILDNGIQMIDYYDRQRGFKKQTGVPVRKPNSILNFFLADSPGVHGVGAAAADRAGGDMDPVLRSGGGGPVNKCESCGSAGVTMNALESYLVCNDCHVIQEIVIDNERTIKRESVRESSTFTFKRFSHFNEWLNLIQAKEYTVIPVKVLADIKTEIAKNKIAPRDLTSVKLRAILKRLKLSRYYEHIPFILCKIKGVNPMRFPTHLEEKLRTMFRQIQAPFVRHSPKSRRNFLSYSYVLNKSIELLGEDAYLPHFPLLKSRDKLYVQDSIWKLICQELDWEFIPSV